MDGGFRIEGQRLVDPPVVLIVQNSNEQKTARTIAMVEQNGHGSKGVIAHDYKPSIIPSWLENCSGIIILGGRSNVDPKNYGKELLPGVEERFDEARDDVTLPLIRAAVGKGIPLFVICRGFQELNVALGGQLHQRIEDVSGSKVHMHYDPDKPKRSGAAYAHWMTLGDDPMCRAIAGDAKRIRVNSLHNQGVPLGNDEDGRRYLSERLKALGWSHGCIEMVTLQPGINDGAFVLGMQPHPDKNPPRKIHRFSDAAFQLFGRAVDAYHAKTKRPHFNVADIALQSMPAAAAA